MNVKQDMLETVDLRSDGFEAWKSVEQAPIGFDYFNPWFRYAAVLVVSLIAGAGIWFLAGSTWLWAIAILLFFGIVSGVKAAYFYFGELRIGVLLAEVSKAHIAVGCGGREPLKRSIRDRIVIPWTAVNKDVTNLPINDKFMAIPVRPEALEQLTFETASTQATWDRLPYKRFLVSVKYNPEMSWVEIHATPNVFFIHLLSMVYPMIAVIKEVRIEERPPVVEARGTKVFTQEEANKYNSLVDSAWALIGEQLHLHDSTHLGKPGIFVRRRLTKAIRLFKQALGTNGDGWQSMWALGKIYQRLGDDREALSWFRRAFTINPKQPDVAREASLAAMNLGLGSEGVQFCLAAVDNEPNESGLVANLALAYLVNGDLPNALENAERAVREKPDDEMSRTVKEIIGKVARGYMPRPKRLVDLNRYI